MTWRLGMELIIVLVLTNFTTWLISWHLGRRSGEKWEKIRAESKARIDKMPYSDLFRKNELVDPNNPPPLIIRHSRRNVRGQWTED